MARKVVGKNFSVEDPPDINDPNLPDVAKFLRVYLKDGSNFYKFGAELVPKDKRTSVKGIQQDTTNLDKKCLELIELWINSVEGREWQDLVEAARKSRFGGLATDLTEEFGSREDKKNSEQIPFQNENYLIPKEHGPEIDSKTLKNRYMTEIKPKIEEKSQLTDLEANEILIQTVNEREFYAAMVKMEKECAISKYTIKSTEHPGISFYYYVGKWGDRKIPVVIVQTEMGSNGTHGSYNETKMALSFLPNLQYIFAVGVCGGFVGEVKLGEVVVSMDLQDCSDMKVADKVQIRGRSWQFKEDPFYHFLKQTGNMPDNTKCGKVLSANNLVANAEFQKKLQEACPGAIALEMEGHGIGRACDEYKDKGRKIQFLVIKGVSDLADKNKNDDWQAQAASNAAKALCEVMTAFHFGH